MEREINNKNSKLKIIISGGHLTPALAVLDEFKRRGIENFIWVGRKFSMFGDKESSAEFQIVKSRGISFIDLKMGKIYRKISTAGIISFLQIPFGFIQALFILFKEKPDLIVSFGGYLAVPVVFWAKMLEIPAVTHEQTVTIGRANKFIQKFAKLVFLSWQSSFDNLSQNQKNSGKFILAGNPIRKAVFQKETDKFDFKNKKKTIYITGGNLGSHIINLNVLKILPQILTKYNVIHQCGSTTVHNDIEMLSKFREKLPVELRKSYIVQTGFWEDEIGAVFANSDFVISRSGANTVTEVLALRKPSILIPIPWSAENEQFLNAKMIENVGLGIILEQKDLNPENLLKRIEQASSIIITEEVKRKINNLLISKAETKIVDQTLGLMSSSED